MDKQKFYAEEKGVGIARSSGKVSCRESPRLCIFMANTYRAKWKMRGRGNDIDREPYRERGIRETRANRSLQRKRENVVFKNYRKLLEIYAGKYSISIRPHREVAFGSSFEQYRKVAFSLRMAFTSSGHPPCNTCIYRRNVESGLHAMVDSFFVETGSRITGSTAETPSSKEKPIVDKRQRRFRCVTTGIYIRCFL